MPPQYTSSKLSFIPEKALITEKKGEFQFGDLISVTHRRWRLIAITTGSTLLISSLLALTKQPEWLGVFQIVVAQKPEMSVNAMTRAAADFPMLEGLVTGGIRSNLETEIKVLESPAVLLPIFNFVRENKLRSGSDASNLSFTKWRKKLSILNEKKTLVLNVVYKDPDRALALEVTQRISQAYQNYSGRDRRRSVTNAVTYLKGAIAALTPKAEASLKQAQAYSLAHDLGLSDGLPPAAEPGDSDRPMGAVEANRQKAQARVRLLETQLAQAGSSGDVLFEAPQLQANNDLYKQYQSVEARLSDLRSRLRDNDDLVRNLQRQRLSLISTINHQTIGLLQGELATARAALQSSTRPKEVLLQHRQLVRKAMRDEKALASLENQLQLVQLEQAKQSVPWELISAPTVLGPMNADRIKILIIGLLIGFLGGCGAALVVERLQDRVFNEDELNRLLPGPQLAHLDLGDVEDLSLQVQLLARGLLAGSQRIVLIPIGLEADGAMLSAMHRPLSLALPNTEVICSSNLLEALHADQRILITAPGAATRQQLTRLRQQLELLQEPISGWILVDGVRV